MDFFILSIYSPVLSNYGGCEHFQPHPPFRFRDPFGVAVHMVGKPIYKRVNVKLKFIICTTFGNYMSFWGGFAGSAVPILKG